MEEPPYLAIKGEQIQISESEKLLGVHINNSLTWTSHIEATLKPEDQWSCKRSPDTWYIF